MPDSATIQKRIELVLSGRDDGLQVFDRAKEKLDKLTKAADVPDKGDILATRIKAVMSGLGKDEAAIAQHKENITALREELAKLENADVTPEGAKNRNVLRETLKREEDDLAAHEARMAKIRASGNPRFDAREQAIRDEMARKIRAMRAAGEAERREAEVQRRLYGEEEKKGAIRQVDRTPEEQSTRDEIARRTRQIREEARRELARREADRAMTGDQPIEETREQIRARMLGPQAHGEASSSGSSEGHRKSEEYSRGFYKELKEAFEPLHQAGKIIAGSGAIAIVGEIGESLQHIPEIAKKFENDLKYGGSKSEAIGNALADSIPAIGALAKGFRAVADYTAHGLEEANKEKYRARLAEQDETHKAVVERFRAHEQFAKPITNGADDALLDASASVAAAGLHGDELERAQASAEYERKKHDINRELEENLKPRENGIALNSEEADKVRKAANAKLYAAQVEFNARMGELDDQRADRDGESEHQLAELKIATRASANETSLRMQGRFLDAELDEIKEAKDKELRELAAKNVEETRGLDPSDFRYKRANERYQDAVAATDRGADDKARAAKEKDRQSESDSEFSHQQEISRIRSDAVAKRLEMVGDSSDAEKIRLAAAHEERVKQIERQAEDDKRLHAEHAKDIEKRKQESLGAENESFSADIGAAEKRDAERYKLPESASLHEAHFFGGLQGIGAGRNEVADALKDLKNSGSKDTNKLLSELIAAVKASGGNIKIVAPQV